MFDPSYNHVSGDTCNSCLKDRVVDRFPRTSHDIVIHYGTIASGNQVVAELTGGRAETVQFIHESVRDYLLTTKRLHPLQRLQVDLSSNFPGASHETLKKCCETYIEIVRSEDPGSGTPSSCLESDPGTQGIKPEDTPFLKYAVRNILFHADAAAEHGVNQERFIDGFPYEQWVKVSDSLVERRTERYGLGVSPLYIFANESVPTLVSSEVRKVPLIDVKGGHYGYPLNAARAHNSKETLKALLVTGEDKFPPSDGPAKENALYVTPQAHEAAIASCMNRNILVNMTLLYWAVEKDKIDLLKILLQTNEVDVDICDLYGRTAFYARQGQAARKRSSCCSGLEKWISIVKTTLV